MKDAQSSRHNGSDGGHGIRIYRKRARRSTFTKTYTFESRLEDLLYEMRQTYETGVSMNHLSWDQTFESALGWIEGRVHDSLVRPQLVAE